MGGGGLQMDTDKHQLKMEEREAFEWSDGGICRESMSEVKGWREQEGPDK